ncbi:hypothetical protein ACT01_10485 [Megasphaera hexanoica]|nr:hypothetical protein ACT01_10485 [Megasphaera hexanoica]
MAGPGPIIRDGVYMIKTAKEARLLAKMNGYREVKRLYPQYIGSIQQAANKGKYVLEVHGPFTCQEEEAIESLKEKGFTVTKHTDVYDDICCEDVYYRISWKEHKSPWQRIKEWFC